jgi:hypothetical protein
MKILEFTLAVLFCPDPGMNTPAARAQRETFWRRLIARWKLSGVPKATFSERERVSGASLGWWLRELDRRDDRKNRSTATQQDFR